MDGRDEHLSDLCALEWGRFGTTKLAPDDPVVVARHLDACEGCRRRLAEFRALDRSIFPYGAPVEDPRSIDRRRALVRWVFVASVVASITAAFLIFR